MQVGDSLSFYWAMNWDANGGSKGFDLRSDGTTIFNVNNGGNATITTTSGTANTDYGTTPMLVTLTRISASQYTFSMTSRSGGSTYNATINDSRTINNFNFYIGNQNSGDGNRNFYFNNFAVTNSGVFNQGGTVANANTFTGTGSLSVGNNTTLELTGGGNNNYTGTTTISNGSTLRFQGTGNSDFVSAISGGGALVMSNSSGVLNLGGNNNGFTGAITVASGILEARNANSLGTTAGGTTIQNGASLKIFTNSSGFVLGENLSVVGTGAGGIGAINNTGGNNSLNGTITLAGNTRINADTTGASGSLGIGGNIIGGTNVLFLGAQGATGTGRSGGDITVSGVIGGTGGTQDGVATTIFKDGSGALTLSGANTNTGATLLNAGTLLVGNNSAFGTGTAQIHWGSAAAKTLASADATARTLDNNFNIYNSFTLGQSSGGTGSLTLGTSGKTVDLGSDNTNTTRSINVLGSHTIAGRITGGANNILLKDGLGTLTLSGANTHSGATLLNTGTLLVGNNAAFGTGTLQIHFDAAGGDKTLASSDGTARSFNNTVNAFNNFTIGQSSGGTGSLTFGGAFNLGDPVGPVNTRVVSVIGTHNISGGVSGSNGLVLQGGGQLNFSGTNTFTGGLFVDSGTASLNGGSWAAGNIDVGGGAQGNAVNSANAVLRVASGNGASFGRNITINAETNSAGVSGNRTIQFANVAGSTNTLSGNINLEKSAEIIVDTANAVGRLSGAISGAGGITKSGVGRLSLSGSSSYSGNTAVNQGELNLAGGSIASSAVTVASGASLTGYGTVGALGGAGSVGPGNSPGIITATQIIPTGGLDFNFEFTGTAPVFNNAANSVNDLIRITGGTPFSQSLSASNIINIYFRNSALYTGGNTPKIVTGGFFTDTPSNFFNSISGATVNYFFEMTGGTNAFNGFNYGTRAQYEAALSNNLTITISTIGQSANFDGPTIDGQILQLEVIPEPSTYALLALAAGTFAYLRWRRRSN